MNQMQFAVTLVSQTITLYWLAAAKSPYRFAGHDYRLTDVEGHVVKDVLA